MRSVLFWIHLTAGVVAGFVILLMSATGVLLAYEKQMLAWSDRTPDAAPPVAGAPRLLVEELLASVRAAEPSGGAVTGVTVSAVDGAPALVTIGQRTIAVNAYTGAVLGDASPRLRKFFRAVTSWHRWLGVEGPGRQVARAFTGWGNLVFLVVIVLGPILWIPRTWTAGQLRAVTLFRSGLRGKARDFNWHNVVGIWCVVPLVVIVASALPMSFPWANAALYRLAGEAPPEGGRGGQVTSRDGVGSDVRRGNGRRSDRPVDRANVASQALNALWQRAERDVENWRSISVRLPNEAKAPATFTIDRGTGGQPQLRSTLTIDRSTGDVIRSETFETQTLGRRLRTFARFAHTGEFFGVVGQTIAGLASAGAVLLTWTGLALALRRFSAWRKRRRDRAVALVQTSAA